MRPPGALQWREKPFTGRENKTLPEPHSGVFTQPKIRSEGLIFLALVLTLGPAGSPSNSYLLFLLKRVKGSHNVLSHCFYCCFIFN